MPGSCKRIHTNNFQKALIGKRVREMNYSLGKDCTVEGTMKKLYSMKG
jgi:hypothetical protein